MPAPDVEGVVALGAVARRPTTAPRTVEIVEVADRARRLVLVIAGRRPRDALESSPRRLVRGLVFRNGRVLVLTVAQCEREVRLCREGRLGGPAHVAARAAPRAVVEVRVGRVTSDVARGHDDRLLSHRERDQRDQTARAHPQSMPAPSNGRHLDPHRKGSLPSRCPIEARAPEPDRDASLRREARTAYRHACSRPGRRGRPPHASSLDDDLAHVAGGRCARDRPAEIAFVVVSARRTARHGHRGQEGDACESSLSVRESPCQDYPCPRGAQLPVARSGNPDFRPSSP